MVRRVGKPNAIGLILDVGIPISPNINLNEVTVGSDDAFWIAQLKTVKVT